MEAEVWASNQGLSSIFGAQRVPGCHWPIQSAFIRTHRQLRC